jgi:hypothetical protein
LTVTAVMRRRLTAALRPGIAVPRAERRRGGSWRRSSEADHSRIQSIASRVRLTV